jgi:hypothetical protein
MAGAIGHKAFLAAALGATLMAGTGMTQAENRQNPPPGSIVPESALEDLPHRQLSNGIVTVKLFEPGFYRGTRFDRSGVAAHATYKGHDFGRPWFDSYSPYVRDFWSHDGQVTVSTVSAAMGPAEEFAPVGFDATGDGGRFLKIGVGILKRSGAAYDFVHAYDVLAEGTRTFRATATEARLTHDLSDRETGYGYHYVKTVRLVPGKARMVIAHVLTNTGSKEIASSVYCHNFLTLDGGNAHVTITAPFDITADKPFASDAATVEGKTIRYLRAVKAGESVTSPISGFGASVGDHDFVVRNTETGFGQRIRADQPLARINFWSIATNVSLEPYIAIDLKPGESKRWTYTYDYFGPGENP